MNAVITSLLQSYVKIGWTPPDFNGSPVIGYRVEIETAVSNVLSEQLEFCNG